MKKTFILIAALAMFAGVAMADNALFQLKAFDANTLLKENVINGMAMSEGALNNNATVDFKASGVQAQYYDTIIGGATVRGYYMLLTSIDGKYQLRFLINDIQDMVDGTTYTLNDMNGDYSYGVDYNLYEYVLYTAVSLTRTAGVYSGTISATSYSTSTSMSYTLNQLQPITHPKDTVIINTTDRVEGRFTDYSSNYGLIQMIGADSKYKMYLAFNTTKPTGTFSESDINSTYSGLVSLADGSQIPLSNLLNDVTVYTIVGAYTATIEWVGTDSVLYNINYTYSDPEALTQTTFAADTFMITKNASYDKYLSYYNQYVYDVKAVSTTGDTLSATIYNPTADNAYGTWSVADRDIDITITDKTQKEYDAFSGSITISANSFTGSSLCYGDVTYTFAISAPTSVDQLESKAYTVYSEGSTIVLKGAEGQSVMLYDMAGRLVSGAKVASNNVRFPVDIAGVYMLRIGNESRRVVVE